MPKFLTVRQKAERAIKLARKELGGEMESSARLALADAVALFDSGDYASALARAARSRAYSGGHGAAFEGEIIMSRKRNPSKMTGVETVTTHELRNGDVIASHGSLFKLKDRKVSQSHDATDYGGEVIWFRTAYLGPLLKGGQESIPSALRKDWIVQGNKLASWARITAAKSRKRNPVANRKHASQAITTKRLPPTNTRGSKVKATSASGVSVTVPWDHGLSDYENAVAAAEALQIKLGWPGTLHGGGTKDGYAFTFEEPRRENPAPKKRASRRKNPAPKLGFVIYAQKGNGPRMHYDGKKFSNNGAPKLYQTQQGAAIVARNALARYPILKPYRVTVEPARGK